MTTPGGRRAVLALAVGVFLVNPHLGCGDEFEFDADDMRREVEGTWRSSGMLDGKPFSLTMKLQQGTAQDMPRLNAVTTTCGTRTLVRPSGACGSSTYMPLRVEVLQNEGAPAGMMRGGFEIRGRLLGGGRLTLQFGDGRTFLDAQKHHETGWSGTATVRTGGMPTDMTVELVLVTPAAR